MEKTNLLKNRIDFIAIISVDGANANGDPETENMPRMDTMGYGEISDVCIKHKLRRRLAMAHIEQGLPDDCEILLTAKDDDLYPGKSIYSRLLQKDGGELLKLATAGVKKKEGAEPLSSRELSKLFCAGYRDIRLFGQVVALSKGEGMSSGVSVGIPGACTIQTAKSVAPISVESVTITKCLPIADSTKRGSDQLGRKYTVSRAAYVLRGSINAYTGEKNGVTEEDAEALREAIQTMFLNDESCARPAGTMEVHELYWFRHDCKIGQYPVQRVFESVKVQPKTDYPYFSAEFDQGAIPGLTPEVFRA